jgi:sporulation protein YlmC with PRC-barrel domain
MAVSVKNINDMFGKDVFTSKGYYAGKVKDLEFDLSRFKIRALIVEASKDSILASMIGGKRGIIVPYPLILAIGDIVIIKHVIPSGTPAEGEITEAEAGLEKV